MLKSVTYGITKLPFLYGYITGFGIGSGRKGALPQMQATQNVV